MDPGVCKTEVNHSVNKQSPSMYQAPYWCRSYKSKQDMVGNLEEQTVQFGRHTYKSMVTGQCASNNKNMKEYEGNI